MATIAERDTTGTLTAAEGEVELVGRRTRTAKVFHLGGRRYRVGGSVAPVHYRRDPFDEREQMKEIDLSLEPTPGEEWDFGCETNGYQVRVWNGRDVAGRRLRYVAQYRRAGRWFEMAPVALAWMNAAGEWELISKPAATEARIEQNPDRVLWRDAFGAGLDFCYTLAPDHFWKEVVIRDKAALPRPTIGGDGLRLVVVMAVAWEGGVQAGNGFAEAVEVALDDDEAALAAADEELSEPGEFDYRDTVGRPLWWVRRPRAWDSGEDQHALPMGCRLWRRGRSARMLLGLDARALTDGSVTYPVHIDASISEERVGASSEDAWSYGSTYPGGSSINLTGINVHFGATASTFRCGGFRFQTVPIPNGVTIDSASMTVYAYANMSPSADVYIAAEDVDDGAAWSSAHKPSDGYAARTTAKARWTISSYWHLGTWHETPDLSGVVQEVVHRAGWDPDNALNFVFYNVGTSLPASNEYRWPASYDRSAAEAAKFNCEYSEPVPGDWLFASD